MMIDYIGAIECRWVIECDCWYDTDDDDYDDNYDDDDDDEDDNFDDDDVDDNVGGSSMYIHRYNIEDNHTQIHHFSCRTVLPFYIFTYH